MWFYNLKVGLIPNGLYKVSIDRVERDGCGFREPSLSSLCSATSPKGRGKASILAALNSEPPPVEALEWLNAYAVGELSLINSRSAFVPLLNCNTGGIIKTLIQIYNHTEIICFDSERIYLIGEGT